jgi:hypothetical protein
MAAFFHVLFNLLLTNILVHKADFICIWLFNDACSDKATEVNLFQLDYALFLYVYCEDLKLQLTTEWSFCSCHHEQFDMSPWRWKIKR